MRTTAVTANVWAEAPDPAATTLTYAPRVSPAPLTASVPGETATLGALEIVITSGTATPVGVDSIQFTVTAS